MEHEAMRKRATAVLSAWNEQDVDRVVACYTEDCVYHDPTRAGPSRAARRCVDLLPRLRGCGR
jgi:ketosteroid isomerase-like protein